jgi:hypothetical protein
VVADAGAGIRRISGRSLPAGHLRRCSRPVLVALTALLTLFAGCAPILQGPPPGNASQVALTAAIAALDPNKQGTEAWQQQNGPYAWAYKVNVGPAQGQNRLMQYYVLNNYGASVSPPLGTSGDVAFVAKMNQITDSYQKADPNHPVVNSIDLVDPVADCCPGPDHLYRHYRTDDDVQHYLQLARDNHMLFFFDTQVGRSTQQDAIDHFMPYLEQPDVNLDIDPEWEMRPGDVPGQVRGRTTAATINGVIDTLSSLVTLRHLPPKILVVHLFFFDEAPDWQNIVLKPGVTLIICADGQGPPYQKIDKYNLFAKAEKYPLGLKVFLQIPCSKYVYCEEPIMTAQQVLALKPAPVMVQYQ